MVVVGDIASQMMSPKARHGKKDQLMLVNSANMQVNERSAKAQRYQPGKEDVALSNHNKSEITLGSPKAKNTNNKISLVASMNHRSSYTIS